MRFFPTFQACLMVTATAATSACDRSPAAPTAPAVAQVNTPLEVAPAALPSPDLLPVAEVPNTAVRITARPDPFRSILLHTEDELPAEGATALERFGLDQLRLVAVVTNTAAPFAMVEDPTGAGHYVKVGTLLGKDGAQVKAIQRGKLVLEQLLRHPDGTVHRMMVPLKLEG
jgi:Tfp pilus assembly protein PilP